MGEARVHQRPDLLLRLGHIPEAKLGHVSHESLVRIIIAAGAIGVLPEHKVAIEAKDFQVVRQRGGCSAGKGAVQVEQHLVVL